MLGQTLGHYRVLEELGRGGMGVVYRARDVRLDRDVAIKVLSPELTRDPELRRRLVQEARAAAALNHPAITVVYDVAEEGEAAFVAMELVRGESLRQRLRRGALGPNQALGLSVELAEALQEGHAHAIVHRDLKPGNVMLTESGHAKIIDFGLAKLLKPRHVLDSGIETPPRHDTEPGRLVGTVAYMSPEQARGRPVDPRADIFCFGALLYEMLTGVSAFERASGIETLHAILHDPTPRLAGLGLGELEAEIQRILDRCLEKDPSLRYPSAVDLAADLRSVSRRLELGESAEAAGSVPAPCSRRTRVVIVDDEEPARALLREYLAPLEVEILAECRNGFEAVKAVSDLRPDLVLLDIQMPKLDGFEVAELIGAEPAVIFVTAYDEHAVRAFEVNAVDYLLKPVSPERLSAALRRARERLQARRPLPMARLVSEARPGPRRLDRILVRQGAQVHVLPVGDIDYVQAQDDYVSLHSGKRELLKQLTLAELEAGLDPDRFVRIHRSYLLNIERLARIESEGRDARVAVLSDGTRLPVSRAGQARLKQLL